MVPEGEGMVEVHLIVTINQVIYVVLVMFSFDFCAMLWIN